MFLMRQNFDAKIILTYAACLDTVFSSRLLQENSENTQKYLHVFA